MAGWADVSEFHAESALAAHRVLDQSRAGSHVSPQQVTSLYLKVAVPVRAPQQLYDLSARAG